MILLKNALKHMVNSYGGKFGSFKVTKYKNEYSQHNVEWQTIEDTAKFWLVCTGSNDYFDWIDNFAAIKVKFMGMRIHAGFLRQAMYIYDNMRPLIKTKRKQIVVAGHSLGGAIAAIIAMLIKIDFSDKEVIVITAGSPKPFGYFTSLIYKKKIKKSYRFVNGQDFVTHLPFFRFFHVGKKIQLGKKGFFLLKLFNFVKWKKSFLDVHNPMEYYKAYK